MADDLKQTGKADDTRINVDQEQGRLDGEERAGPSTAPRLGR